MASLEQAHRPVNGTYGAADGHHAGTPDEHSGANSHPHQASGAAPTPDAFGAQNANVSGTTPADDAHAEVPKHEVGWYFVKQYYTNLSRSPDKWHLFYTKRSQFVSGVEAEKVPVSVGRTAIAERIKELDFQDCKVRVSNVDSQASFNNIVIQVIGEISNKSAPHRKFVQTFVLAQQQQPNGYFVLNDIFRYINEEDEDETDVDVYHEAEPSEVSEAAQAEPVSQDAARTLTGEADPVRQQHDVEQLDAGLEKVIASEEPPRHDASEEAPDEETSMTNGTATAEVSPDQPPDESQPANDIGESTPAMVGEGHQGHHNSEDVQPESPKAPEPTPAISPRPQPAASHQASPPASTMPAKPTAPKTWAKLVATSRTSAPTASSPPSSTSPAPTGPRAAPPSAEVHDAPPSPAPQGSNAGWQTAGNESAKRQSRPPSTSGGPGSAERVLAYVKNVTDKVSADALREALLQHGDLAYFDISRQKNCAFVEFSTAAGYSAAVAANPHQIGGEQIYVEERRPRSGAYGGASYNANRGGQGRGRGGPDGRMGHPGRGGFQKDGRGSYNPSRGRAGTVTPRGRGGNQSG